MSADLTAIVAALPEEMRPLAGRLADRHRERRGGVDCWHGRLADRQVALAIAGDGAPAAARGAESVLAAYRPSRFLGFGVAGGLSPDLPAGTLLAAREVLGPGGRARGAEPGWLRRAVATGEVVEGRLTSVDRVVASAEAKRALWRELGRPSRIGVDLESAAWADAAARHGVPWLVVRAVSDAAGESLPLPFDRLASAAGGVSRPRTLAHLALRPWRTRAVMAMRRRVLTLAERLAVLVEELVR